MDYFRHSGVKLELSDHQKQFNNGTAIIMYFNAIKSAFINLDASLSTDLYSYKEMDICQALHFSDV